MKGLFDAWASPERQRSSLIGPPAPVTLHIYDLGHAVSGVNMLCRVVGTGAFHAGVEVYGQEWSFSCTGDGPHGTGIFCCAPRCCSAHVYREPVPMGETYLTMKDVKDLIDKLALEWPGSGYDMLRHNCCHFSDELCTRLGVGSVPGWVTSLAGVGAMLRSGVRLAVDGAGIAVGGAVQGVRAAVDLVAAEEEPDNADAPGKLVRRRTEIVDVAQDPFGVMKHMGSPAAQGNSHAGYRIGDEVEVFSNSHQTWCPGRVESLGSGDMVHVAFKLPGAAATEWATKVLPALYKDLRRRTEKCKAESASCGDYCKGDQVEVFSHSKQVWCPGFVKQIHGNMLELAFRWPGSGPDELSHKKVPTTCSDIRKPQAAAVQNKAPDGERVPSLSLKGDATVSPASGSKSSPVELGASAARNSSRTVGISKVNPQRSDVLGKATLPPASSASEVEPNPSGKQDLLRVGDWAEVYSNSQKVWCVGRITQVTQEAYKAVFQMPGAEADDWLEKHIAIGSDAIRRAANCSSNEERPQPVWSDEERVAYTESFRELLKAGEGEACHEFANAKAVGEYIQAFGLQGHVLTEIWKVANPHDKSTLSMNEFFKCCRLIGHCQVAADGANVTTAKVLAQGGMPLQTMLENDMLATPPPRLARINGPTLMWDQDGGDSEHDVAS